MKYEIEEKKTPTHIRKNEILPDLFQSEKYFIVRK